MSLPQIIICSIFNHSKHLFKPILFDNVLGNRDSENMYLTPQLDQEELLATDLDVDSLRELRSV